MKKDQTFQPFHFLFLFCLLVLFQLFTACENKQEKAGELPNFLMITSEDNSAYFLGCYGNEMADTPNLDQLA
jgi:N-sulfoglucosamine sulfohydrolase